MANKSNIKRLANAFQVDSVIITDEREEKLHPSAEPTTIREFDLIVAEQVVAKGKAYFNYGSIDGLFILVNNQWQEYDKKVGISGFLTTEAKIKLLKGKLRALYPNIDTKNLGFWSVGSEEVWPATREISDDGNTFKVEVRNGEWIISPYTTAKKSVSFMISGETYSKLNSISVHENRSMTGVIEWLVAEKHTQLFG